MSTKSKQQFLVKVLKEVNRIRKVIYSKASELHHLPKGDVHEAVSCPLANAFFNKFEVSSAELTSKKNVATVKKIADVWNKPVNTYDDSYVAVHLPSLLSKFVDQFDNGDYPELILDDND